jgi:hypothetical protein
LRGVEELLRRYVRERAHRHACVGDAGDLFVLIEASVEENVWTDPEVDDRRASGRRPAG